jgi:hypothetical protein
MLLRDGGIEHLCHGCQHILILHGNGDGVPKILIPFDVSRHADLMKDLGYIVLQILLHIVQHALIRFHLPGSRQV